MMNLRRRFCLIAAMCLLLGAWQVPDEGSSPPPVTLTVPQGPANTPTPLIEHARYGGGLLFHGAAWPGQTAKFEGLTDDAGRPLVPQILDGEGKATLPPCVVVGALWVTIGDTRVALTGRTIAGIWAILPPVLAILLALLFKEVVVALLCGVALGAVAIEGHVGTGLLRVADRHLVESLASPDHAKIVIFSCLLGALVAMITRMGGIAAMVSWLSERRMNRKRSQLATAFLGLLIFFDDYANALFVGNGMRPITDRYRVSREKLAYLVDSTSAPVACIAPVSTWIAAEVGYIGDWLNSHGGSIGTLNGEYDVFLASIPYNFYPLLAIFFAFLVAYLGRDFGPMARAEKRAALEGQPWAPGQRSGVGEEMETLTAADSGRLYIWNALLPLGVLIGSVLMGLYWDGIGNVNNADSLGWFERLRAAYGSAASSNVLLWSSAGALLFSAVLATSQRLMNLKEVVHTALLGFKAMLPALVVLVLAWALADICKALNTSGYLIEQVSFSATFLPLITFLLASAIAFSTGTSWGTMAILVPLVLSYATDLGAGSSPEALQSLVLGGLGAVLAGAVFGDHCSPISDTTVMSSMAAGCDHVDHVRTQIPYALTVGLVAAVAGYLPAGYGFSPYASLFLGAGLLVMILLLLGRRV